MIIPDVNLLIYAYSMASPHHSKAKAWWEHALSGHEPVGLPQVVIFGFVRLVTNAHVMDHPISVPQAMEHVRSWIEQPTAQVLRAGPEHCQQVLSLLERIGAVGNLVMDAQIAALAIEHEAIVHTTDTDFARFPGLRWFNPITGAKGSNPS